MLFLIFINDLPADLKSSIKILADDTKIYNSSKNSGIIQDDINKMMKWSETWQLSFNENKRKVLYIGKKNPKNKYYMNGFCINST